MKNNRKKGWDLHPALLDEEAFTAWCYFADRPWYGETWLPWLRHAKGVALGALEFRWLVMLGKPTECEPMPSRVLSSCKGATKQLTHAVVAQA